MRYAASDLSLRRLQLVRGPLTGALTLPDVQSAPLPTVVDPRARLPLAQEGERRVARMTPHPPSSPRRRGGGSAQPPEPWRWARDELKLAKAPLPGAPNVVVLQTTAGWRKAPAPAQRVCTRGLASPSSISLKNTMNTAGLEWFGPPERNTLRPLCVVLPSLEREGVRESLCVLPEPLCTAITSLLYLKGGAYMAVGSPIGGPNDVV